MRVYRSMEKLAGPLPYVGKIMLICFVGTHIPLIALCAWAFLVAQDRIPLSVFGVVLIATLMGTAFALWALHRMLRPVSFAVDALESYAAAGALPALPTEYSDEAGRLMSSVQRTLLALDAHIEEISRIAMTDGLTGVRNRRWMMDVGIPKFSAAHRDGELTTLLMIDLDKFKSVNDRLGHTIGDRVLLLVADSIKAAVRASDEVVRVGGDEFCVLLPGTDKGAGLEVAERIRKRANDALAQLLPQHDVTISLGLATTAAGDASFEDLYRKSDEQLYAAKRVGGNSVRATGASAERIDE